MNPHGLPHIKKQWHFNSTLLSDDTFVKYVEEQIAFFLLTTVSPETSNLSVWDALKAYLRGQIIFYTANMKKELIKRDES